MGEGEKGRVVDAANIYIVAARISARNQSILVAVYIYSKLRAYLFGFSLYNSASLELRGFCHGPLFDSRS